MPILLSLCQWKTRDVLHELLSLADPVVPRFHVGNRVGHVLYQREVPVCQDAERYVHHGEVLAHEEVVAIECSVHDLEHRDDFSLKGTAQISSYTIL